MKHKPTLDMKGKIEIVINEEEDGSAESGSDSFQTDSDIDGLSASQKSPRVEVVIENASESHKGSELTIPQKKKKSRWKDLNNNSAALEALKFFNPHKQENITVDRLKNSPRKHEQISVSAMDESED